MCVAEKLLSLCEQMSQEITKSTVKITCVAARDRYANDVYLLIYFNQILASHRLECLEKIQTRKADFETVDPEDMYIAARYPDQDFAVFEEIRTREEPDGGFFQG